jgi:hypothetical protein
MKFWQIFFCFRNTFFGRFILGVRKGVRKGPKCPICINSGPFLSQGSQTGCQTKYQKDNEEASKKSCN